MQDEPQETFLAHLKTLCRPLIFRGLAFSRTKGPRKDLVALVSGYQFSVASTNFMGTSYVDKNCISL